MPTHPTFGERIDHLERFGNQLKEAQQSAQQALEDLDYRRCDDAARKFALALKIFPESRALQHDLALAHHLKYRSSRKGDPEAWGMLSPPEKIDVEVA